MHGTPSGSATEIVGSLHFATACDVSHVLSVLPVVIVIVFCTYVILAQRCIM